MGTRYIDVEGTCFEIMLDVSDALELARFHERKQMGKVLRAAPVPPTTETTAVVESVPVTDVEATIAARGGQYGSFAENTKTMQGLKVLMRLTPNWPELESDQQEALELIAHKIGRILHGNQNNHDSWHDIVGYAKLVADRLAGLKP